MKRADSESWAEAKREGDAAELLVARWFMDQGQEVTRSVDRAQFDLLVQARVEVKRDLLAVKTGYVAVETTCRGQDSGILTSGATWWAFVLDDGIYLVKTANLRQQLQQNQYEQRDAGTGKCARVHLLPLNEMMHLPAFRFIPMEGLRQ